MFRIQLRLNKICKPADLNSWKLEQKSETENLKANFLKKKYLNLRKEFETF